MTHSRKPGFLRIAIPTPLRRTFDYLPPAGIDPEQLQAGIRIRVPFGRSEVIGVLLEVTHQAAVEKRRMKRARDILDHKPVLPEELMRLLIWASRYYQHPIGEVVQQALPGLLRKGKKALSRGIPHWQLTNTGRQCNPSTLRRAPRQAQLLRLLQQHPEGLNAGQIDAHEKQWRPVMSKLVERGLVEIKLTSCLAPPLHETAGGLTLNTAQQEAVARVEARLAEFHPFLLDGVTGSGKTEVYLHLIERVLANGQQALILVPEIGLTPQLLSRFRQRLPVRIALLHSALNEQERLCAWLAAASGEAGVVLGTRSALFTPLARPGLFIVDEEHDISLKQQEGFRYSARDLLVLRARQLNIPIILGSATPSLESLHNCQAHRFEHLHLPERAGQAQPPRFRLVDVRGQKLEHGLSAQLLTATQTHLNDGGQVLLFINRRGFAPVLMCHMCGWHHRCERCDAHMTMHQQSRRQRCHHCGSERPLPRICPECGSSELIPVGYGTERVEEALGSHFPDVPVLRIDRDTTRRKGAMQQMLEQIAEGSPRILVGTQMLAKGHHFPNLTLVGLLDADYGLFSADFRAAERLGQLVLQVAGRAGRAERPGEVLIQTHHPDSPLLQILLTHDYGRFAQSLLKERKAARLPPFSHLVLLRAEATDERLPGQFLAEARAAAEALQTTGIELFGPLPAPMARRAGRSRAQLLLQAEERNTLQQLLSQWLPRLENLKSGRKVRWSLDVDPLEMF